MTRGFKIAYGVCLALVLIGGAIALMATRASAFSAGPVDDSSSNWSTLLFGAGGTGGVLTLIVQVVRMLMSRGGGSGSAAYEVIFNAILSGFDMASGRAAHSTGSHALPNGTLEWDVKFTPTNPPAIPQANPVPIPVPSPAA